MVLEKHRDVWDVFERSPSSKQAYIFMTHFYYYWHDQDLFIDRLKQQDLHINNSRIYYKTLKRLIDSHPEFIRRWVTNIELLYSQPNRRSQIAPNSLLYEEVMELQELIYSIITGK